MDVTRATIILSGLLTLFGIADHASACSCMGNLPPRAALGGADADAKTEDGTTALMIALPSGRRDVLAREEQRRRDPDWTDPRLAMIGLLLEAGADVDAVDAYGRTALTQAEALEDTAVVALLREAASEK